MSASLPLGIVLLATLLLPAASAADARPHFLAADAIDVSSILPGPPPDDSPATRRELDVVLARQASRTESDVRRIAREGKWRPELFDDVIGPWFTGANLPATLTLLDIAGHDTMAIGDRAKKYWHRTRPPGLDHRVHPSVGLPDNSSYPSAHGAYGVVLATLLAELAPDLRAELMTRGRQIGDDRVLGGVHFPSDVDAGRALAPVILERLRANPDFQSQLARAKVEFETVRARFAPSPVGPAK